MANGNDHFRRLMDELHQAHSLRKSIYGDIEKCLGENKRVVSLFTSFRYPVILEDADADMLEEVLRNTDLDGKELALILNCPGGDGLAAERIVNLCRSYCPTGFSVIVPKMAKSAATMLCLGANEIIMSATSELGPIDPQILIRDDKGDPLKYQAAHEIVGSYEELLKLANTTTGQLAPYLQQLARYDARDIRNIKSAQRLSEDVAVNLLKSGLFKKLTVKQIKTKIKALVDPNKTISHGRPLFHNAVKKCGLNVRVENSNSQLWGGVWNLYLRLNNLTNTTAAKVLESASESYIMAAP